MVQQVVNIGSAANDGTGDPLRTAFTKVNQNFTELYGKGAAGANFDFTDNTLSSTNTNGDIELSPNGTGQIILDYTAWPLTDGSVNRVLTTDGAGNLYWSTGAVAGDKQVTFVADTFLKGSANFVYDENTDTLAVPNIAVANITVTDLVSITASTAASSTTTGALKVAGGMGVVDNIYVGGNVVTAGLFQGDGGLLTNIAVSAGTSLFNGTSNVRVGLNTDIIMSSAGANVVVVTGTGANIAGTANITGAIDGGSTLNIVGNANTGNLGTTTVIATTGNVGTINSGLMQNGNSNVTISANGNVSLTATSNTTVVVTPTGANVAGYANITGEVAIGGNLTVTGDFTVNGTTTTINTTTLDVEDLNITIAKGAASSVAANGAGITVDGASATILYNSTTDRWVLNKDLTVSNVHGNLSGNATTAGTVVNPSQSNITSVGTLSSLTVSGNANVGNLGTAQVLASANITTPQLISNIATGTAPIVVSSTTQVANLNSQYSGNSVTANTVVDASQPNITSVGILTSITTAAGTTSVAPINLTSGTNLTSVTAGAVEYDGTVLQFTPNTDFGRAIIPTAVYTSGVGANLTPTATGETTAQSLFPSGSDTITLSIGTYHIEMGVQIFRGATSTSSAAVRINFGGGGTAVGSFSGYTIASVATGGNGNLIPFNGVTLTADNTVTTAIATGGGNYNIYLSGILRITTAGSIQPKYSLSNALTGATTATSTSALNFMVIKSIASSGSAASTGGWV